MKVQFGNSPRHNNFGGEFKNVIYKSVTNEFTTKRKREN